MIRRVWRVLRSALRCPVTPVVLTVVMVVDLQGLAEGATPYHGSTIGEWWRDHTAWGPASRTHCRFNSGYAIVCKDESGKFMLDIDQQRQIPPQNWQAQLALSFGTRDSGFYAQTYTVRSAQLSIAKNRSLNDDEINRLADEYIDHVLEHPIDYLSPLKDPSTLDGLRSEHNIYNPVPDVEYRIVSESDILWLGVFHNTLAAAALLGLLVSLPWSLCTIPGRIRRWRYKGPGRCNTCGYDITAVPNTTTCPECGTPVSTETITP